MLENAMRLLSLFLHPMQHRDGLTVFEKMRKLGKQLSISDNNTKLGNFILLKIL